ncbi:RNA polymerase II transcription initiation/nucleotide excision repair factor TFIIH, partial [Trachipleistophora hominis]
VVNGCSKGLAVMEEMITTASKGAVTACASHKEHDIESLSTFNQKKWPGNLRKDVHVLSILRRILEFLRIKLKSTHLTINTPHNFVCSLENLTFISRRTLSFLKKRFQAVKLPFDENVDKLNVLVDMMDTLARYAGSNAFSVIFEPLLSNNSLSPKITLSCNDSRIAMSALKFRSIMVTSGTLTPFDVYMRLLGITGRSVSIRGSTKEVLIVSKGNDQINISSDVSLESDKTAPARPSSDAVPITETYGSVRNAGLANDFESALLSSSYKLRTSSSTVRNYATLIKDLCDIVPDGMIIFFPSYVFMHEIISKCEFMIKKLHKLIFIETINYEESINALMNYKRAIKHGRGAIMFCVARGKVSEGIDFKNEEGRCVLLIGVPFAFTESVIIKERLKFLKQNINLNAFLQFDALRHALQCLGRVVRGKNDYGLMVMADYRYNSYKYGDEYDVIDGLSVDMCVNIGKAYFRKMANRELEKMLDEDAVLKLLEGEKQA